MSSSKQALRIEFFRCEDREPQRPRLPPPPERIVTFDDARAEAERIRHCDVWVKNWNPPADRELALAYKEKVLAEIEELAQDIYQRRNSYEPPIFADGDLSGSGNEDCHAAPRTETRQGISIAITTKANGIVSSRSNSDRRPNEIVTRLSIPFYAPGNEPEEPDQPDQQDKPGQQTCPPVPQEIFLKPIYYGIGYSGVGYVSQGIGGGSDKIVSISVDVTHVSISANVVGADFQKIQINGVEYYILEKGVNSIRVSATASVNPKKIADIQLAFDLQQDVPQEVVNRLTTGRPSFYAKALAMSISYRIAIEAMYVGYAPDYRDFENVLVKNGYDQALSFNDQLVYSVPSTSGSMARAFWVPVPDDAVSTLVVRGVFVGYLVSIQDIKLKSKIAQLDKCFTTDRLDFSAYRGTTAYVSDLPLGGSANEKVLNFFRIDSIKIARKSRKVLEGIFFNEVTIKFPTLLQNRNIMVKYFDFKSGEWRQSHFYVAEEITLYGGDLEPYITDDKGNTISLGKYYISHTDDDYPVPTVHFDVLYYYGCGAYFEERVNRCGEIPSEIFYKLSDFFILKVDTMNIDNTDFTSVDWTLTAIRRCRNKEGEVIYERAGVYVSAHYNFPINVVDNIDDLIFYASRSR